MTALAIYIRESVAELRKVVWPTKQQTTSYSLIVIGMSIAVAIFFALLDYVLNLGLGALL